MKRILLILALVWSVSARAATGEVELVGTTITSDAPSSGNVFDNDTTTWWGVNPGNWIGIDLGTGTNATLTGWAFAPKPSSSPSSYTCEVLMQGAVMQSDTTAAFSAPTTRDTVPTFPFYPRFKVSERAATGSARCFRVYFSGFPGIAELKFYASASTTARARPMAPKISPWGGRFPSGSQTVTITSRTTSASIYYTTNGTTPTTASTLYTGPFSFAFGSTTQIKAIANDASLSTPASTVSANAFFSPWSYKPNEDWRDDLGILAEAHYGDIYNNTAADGFYYWYGGALNFADSGVDLPTGGYQGVWMLKSTDLRNWQFVGNILPDLGMTVQRPHFVKNPSTGLLVLWAHNINNSLACVATSTLPVGPWNWISTNTQPIGGVKDCNLFQDTDGRAFFIHTDTNQVSGTGKMRITLLSSDYLTPSTTQAVVRINSSDEAPVLFRNGTAGNYYVVFSAGNYYDNLSTYNERWVTCTNVLGVWTNAPVNQLWTVDPVNDARYTPASSYNGQPSFVIKYNNQWILGRDQWHNASTEPASGLYNSRQVWVPFAFDGAGTIVVPSPVPVPWEPSVLPTYKTVRQLTGKSKRSGSIK
jgi:hypothetical protein